MAARLETASDFADLDFEELVRLAVNKPTGPIADGDVRGLTSLRLNETIHYLHDLCHLPNLTLTMDGMPFLPAGPDTETTAMLPYRVETTRGVFLGDWSMGLAKLTVYAKRFEQEVTANLAQDTGLTPTDTKPVFELYGDEATWNRATGNASAYGYYSPVTHRIRMAHWKGQDAWKANEILLTHEYLHWLAYEVGQAKLPTWFNEGLAHNEAWRWYWKSAGWDGPFVDYN